MWELFVSKLSFAAEPVIGVSLIGIYFVWMMVMATKRVAQGDHMKH